jgi:hypothetical protein
MISAYDRIRISAAIIAHPRTVYRVYLGQGSDYSRRRVAEAARRLALPLPPEPSPSSSESSLPVQSKAA